MFTKKAFLKNITKFTGKHACQSLFFKRLRHRCFLVNFCPCENFQNSFLLLCPRVTATTFIETQKFSRKVFYNFLSSVHSKHICIYFSLIKYLLSLPSPCTSESCIKIKIHLNFYFLHTSLWCFERFYEGLEGLHKTF